MTACGYLPSRKASATVYQHQTILLRVVTCTVSGLFTAVLGNAFNHLL